MPWGCHRDPELGMTGQVDMKWPMMRLANIYKVARARLVDHMCPFWAMGIT